MQTKSNIQLIRENLAVRDTFKANLEAFMDKYMVEDSFFTPSKKVLGEMVENVKGYFVFEHEYNTFNEAISNMNHESTIRIIENKRFQIGKVYERLSEAKGDRVIDITTGMAAISTEENND
jgi:hypothetical protein